jgi:hypothetical protein
MDDIKDDSVEEEEEEVHEVPDVPLTSDIVTSEPEDGTVNYRYLCPACTGIAFYATTKDKFVSVCNSCGKAMPERFEGNYIPLTEDEKASLGVLNEG